MPIPLKKQRVNGQDIPLPDPAADGRPHTVLGGKLSSETVEIEGFSTDRDSNFDKAKLELYKKIGRENADRLLKTNLYTWHEMEDCKTLILVPRIIHGNMTHTGGVSIVKGGKL